MSDIFRRKTLHSHPSPTSRKPFIAEHDTPKEIKLLFAVFPLKSGNMSLRTLRTYKWGPKYATNRTLITHEQEDAASSNIYENVAPEQKRLQKPTVQPKRSQIDNNACAVDQPPSFIDDEAMMPKESLTESTRPVSPPTITTVEPVTRLKSTTENLYDSIVQDSDPCLNDQPLLKYFNEVCPFSNIASRRNF